MLINFERPSEAILDLFPGVDGRDRCYAKGLGKIDGRTVFLEFIVEVGATTVMVNHGSSLSQDEMSEYELVLQHGEKMDGKKLLAQIEWEDTNTEFLQAQWGFELHTYGTASVESYAAIKAEVIWLDLDLSETDIPEPLVVDISETLAIAVREVTTSTGELYFYQHVFNDRGENRQCLVVANRRGLFRRKVLDQLVQRWCDLGGVR
jgi:hypothetical protein